MFENDQHRGCKSSIIENKNDNPNKFIKMINCIFGPSNMGSIRFWSLKDSLSMQKITTTLKLSQALQT